MGSQEFVIKGTVEGMLKILEKDFSMSHDEAKFFVYILINQYRGESVNTINKEELDLWYLVEEEKYEGRISNTHTAIRFSSVKRGLYHKAFEFFATWFFNRKIDLVLIGIDLVSLVVSSVVRIKDTDFCVYARIIELCIGNKERIFSEGEIVTANKDGKCDYQESEWTCTYMGQQENCTCDQKKIELAFKNLEEQNIIRRVGERWMLVQ